MINNRWRNNFFYNALHKTAKNKIVLDMGSGTGILAFYALSAGARFVYCVEEDIQMCAIIEKVLSKTFSKTQFKVINANFWTGKLDNQIENEIDILVSETVGPGLFDQGMIRTWNSIKPFLSKDAISIPDRLHCDVWISPIPVNATPQHYFLTCDSLISNDFAMSLIEVDNELKVNNACSLEWIVEWIDMQKNKITPVKQYQNIISYTMNHGPNFLETNRPDISFEANIEEPSKISIINKMSFQDNTIFLKDALNLPWKFVPTINIPEKGVYTFSYNNNDLRLMTKNEWIFKIKENA